MRGLTHTDRKQRKKNKEKKTGKWLPKLSVGEKEERTHGKGNFSGKGKRGMGRAKDK